MTIMPDLRAVRRGRDAAAPSAAPPRVAMTCFQEADPTLPLLRRAGVEGLGTALLMLAAGGAGEAAERAFGHGSGMILPVLALAVPGALVGLVVALGPFSGGHFNPLISGLQWLAGERSRRCFAAYFAAQLAGGALGGAAAAAIWGETPGAGGAAAVGWAAAASELIASAGLMLVVFGASRGFQRETGPFAVGAWLMAAIVALPSTSYANPAIALGAVLATGPVALPASALAWFWPAQVVGALGALFAVTMLFPKPDARDASPPPSTGERS